MESGDPLGPLPLMPLLTWNPLWVQQLPRWLCPYCGRCWLQTVLPAREVPGVGRHQLALPWRSGIRVQAHCPLFLGKRTEKGTLLLVPGAVGALATPFFLLLRLQVPKGWEEAPESTGGRSKVM